jgi:hypothetical protein
MAAASIKLARLISMTSVARRILSFMAASEG